jgi:hypothetical protein
VARALRPGGGVLIVDMLPHHRVEDAAPVWILRDIPLEQSRLLTTE